MLVAETKVTSYHELLIYFFKDDIKDKIVKSVFITACIAFFVLIGFSRIYLNAHWFSDVIAGFSLAIFWLTLFILLFRFLAIKETKFL